MGEEDCSVEEVLLTKNTESSKDGGTEKRKRSVTEKEEEPVTKVPRLPTGEEDAKEEARLTILSWNVHHSTGAAAIHHVLLHHAPTIALLQEVRPKTFAALTKLLDASPPRTSALAHRLKGAGVAILSSLPLTEVARGMWEKGRRGFLAVKVEGVVVLNLHLDSKEEPRRLEELDQVRRKVEGAGAAQVWAGDFNSLTRADYSALRWRQVVVARRRAGLEAPQLAVTSLMAELGMVDCRGKVGGRGEAATCSHGTRVDYVYSNKQAAKAWRCEELQHLDFGPSDHRALLAVHRRGVVVEEGNEAQVEASKVLVEEVDEEVLLLEDYEQAERVEVVERVGGWGDLGRRVLEELARAAVSEDPAVGWWAAPQAVLVALCRARGWPLPGYRVRGDHCTVVVGEEEYGEQVGGGGRELAAVSALHRLGCLQ